MANQKNKIFDYIEFKYSDLTKQITNWLSNLYNKSGLNYSSASPYGSILSVQEELFQHNMIYLKQATQIINIEETVNEKAIRNLARIAGYSASRAISATGTLKFVLKNNDVVDKIKGGGFTITNKLLLRNKTNNLSYSVDLGSDQMTVSIKGNTVFYLPIIQGIYTQSTVTGNGKPGQSYTIQTSNNSQVENFRYTISYNGTLLANRVNLYDMLPLEWACYTRTGFNGGLDVYFGTNDYGFIPGDGSTITVDFLVSNGKSGEILNPVANDWKIIGEVKDIEGNSLSLDKLFNITVETNIGFASDGDDAVSIKNNIPYTSKNFVLASPPQFIFHLSKLNMFSKINAFNKLEDNDFSLSETVVEDSLNQLKAYINTNKSKEQINNKMDQFLSDYAKNKNNLNDNEIYLYLIPDVTKYFSNNVNYFNIPLDVFYLDDDEQNKVLTYLNSTGIMSTTTDVIIIQPTIVKYIMHVYVRRFSNAKEDNIRQDTIQTLSNYLIKNTRFDRMPKSDFIKLIKDNVSGVDSVDVYFVCQKNEDYHANATNLGISYNSELVLGLDSVHGDIVVNQDEYPIVRGGWKDRNSLYYNEDPNNMNGLTSINIIFDGVTNV